MSGAAHTPGPWEIRAQGNVIGQVGGDFVVGLNDVSHKDAVLLAAAPEMLDQLGKAAETFADLETVFRAFGYPKAGDACEVAQKATRAVIAKATGAAS